MYDVYCKLKTVHSQLNTEAGGLMAEVGVRKYEVGSMIQLKPDR